MGFLLSKCGAIGHGREGSSAGSSGEIGPIGVLLPPTEKAIRN